MYNACSPDFIIGSNVSYNEAPPTDDNLMSQIKNMFSYHSVYLLPCENGIIIEPDLEISEHLILTVLKKQFKLAMMQQLHKLIQLKARSCTHFKRRQTKSKR